MEIDISLNNKLNMQRHIVFHNAKSDSYILALNINVKEPI